METKTEGHVWCSWVDNWFDDDINFQRSWIRQHAADGGFLGKPVRASHAHGMHILSGAPPNTTFSDEGGQHTLLHISYTR